MRTSVYWLVTACLVLLNVPAQAEDKKPSIRFGLQVAQQQTTVEELRDVWQEAEALGFDTLWVNDHLLPSVGPSDEAMLESWTLLGAMAVSTSKIQIGCMVTSNTFRHPSILAKMATTVDHLSNGRLIFGIGSGWFKREHEAYGVEFSTMKGRARRLDEALQVITKLWQASPTASHAGKYYSLVDAPFVPKPVQQPMPPIMIGGVGEKLTLPIVARYAQMWNAPILSPDQFAKKNQVLEQYCQDINRDCSEIERSYLTPMYLNPSPEALQQVLQRAMTIRGLTEAEARQTILAGTPAEIRTRLQTYIDIGVTHFIINLRRPGLYDREAVRVFAKEIMPALR